MPEGALCWSAAAGSLRAGLAGAEPDLAAALALAVALGVAPDCAAVLVQQAARGIHAGLAKRRAANDHA